LKILTVKQLDIPEIKVIRFARFCDHRGYFTEPFRRSDLQNDTQTSFMKGVEFVQSNESFSKAGTIRGLHFQWDPPMGKLVRTLRGHMIDMILDIRKQSPTFGSIVAYDMPAREHEQFDEWIWIPPGFAHGNIFLDNTHIEYLCSAEYSPATERGISPLSADIDWSLCDRELKNAFDQIVLNAPLMTDKDRHGPTVSAWSQDERSNNVLFNDVSN